MDCFRALWCWRLALQAATLHSILGFMMKSRLCRAWIAQPFQLCCHRIHSLSPGPALLYTCNFPQWICRSSSVPNTLWLHLQGVACHGLLEGLKPCHILPGLHSSRNHGARLHNLSVLHLSCLQNQYPIDNTEVLLPAKDGAWSHCTTFTGATVCLPRVNLLHQTAAFPDQWTPAFKLEPLMGGVQASGLLSCGPIVKLTVSL